MKRRILFTVIVALVIAVASAIQAQNDSDMFRSMPQPVADQAVWQEMKLLIQANPQFADPNQLKPGESVMIPIDSLNTWVISVDKWRATHGTSCMWDIAKAKLDGSLKPDWDVQKAQPIEATVAPAKADTVFVEKGNQLAWLWALVLALMIAAVLLVWFLSNRISHRLKDGHPRFVYARDDQRRYPPVARWGLTGHSPQNWGQQINASHPDLNALGRPTVVRGRLVTADGSSAGRVVVETGETNPNGTRMTREVTIRNGHEAAQATYPNGTVRYFSWGCINGLVGGERLGLPAGWTFVPDQAQQPIATVTTAATDASTGGAASNAEHPSEVQSPQIERRTFNGPAIRIRREQSVNGTNVDEWTIETDGELQNPIDRLIVHDPAKGSTGDTAAVEVSFLRPAPAPKQQ